MAQKLTLAEWYHVPEMRPDSQASSRSQAPLLCVRLMRYARLSASGNDSTGQPDSAGLLVPRDFPDGDNAHGHRVEASGTRNRLRLQDRVAHESDDPKAD